MSSSRSLAQQNTEPRAWQDVTKTGNGEWGMGNGNGEWGMGNGEWEWGMGMGNGKLKWEIGNGKLNIFFALTFYNVE